MAKKFIRKDVHKKKRIPLNWRRPKGITNKRRLNRKGHAPNVRPGYGTKAADRGKNKQGLMIITVATLSELKALNPKTQAALIAGVGKKRKIELISEAEKLKITLANFNVKKYKEAAEKFLQKKKQEAEKRKEHKKEEEKAAKEKETKEKETSEEKTPEENSVEKNSPNVDQAQRKKEEKAEKDKILTKGQ